MKPIDPFLPTSHSNMLRKLDPDRDWYNAGGITYWEAKNYLWEKHKMTVCVDINRNKQCFCCVRGYSMDIIIPENILSDNWKPNFHDSPIIAEQEGIKQIIEHLYNKAIK